jgi:transcriptional regulator with XRE-family HTH domain
MASTASIDERIAERVKRLRQAAEISIAQLAERTGVSRAMISRIERAEASATAVLLGRLCAGLGISLSALLANEAPSHERVRRSKDQAIWRDPATGYVRRQISVPTSANPVEIVEIQLPPGATVPYKSWEKNAYRQQLYLLSGKMRVTYGSERFDLTKRDCLEFGVDKTVRFSNMGNQIARYLLVIRN